MKLEMRDEEACGVLCTAIIMHPPRNDASCESIGLTTQGPLREMSCPSRQSDASLVSDRASSPSDPSFSNVSAYFQGGGWCASVRSCTIRAGSTLGTTRLWKQPSDPDFSAFVSRHLKIFPGRF